MCMGRIINAGVKKVYYGVTDETGGMPTRFDALPPFWKEMAPPLRSLAGRLLRPMAMKEEGKSR